MTDKPESQFAQLQAIAKELVALNAYNDGGEIVELQKRARRALKTPVGNPEIRKAAKKSIQARQASAAAFKQQVMPHIERARASGRTTTRDIAQYLNDNNVATPRGTTWSSSTVFRVLQ